MKRSNLLAVTAMIVLSCSVYARDSYQNQMQKALAEVKIPQGYTIGTYMEFETLQSGDPRLLDVITPGLRNAPQSDLQTLMGGETQLTITNYSAVIARLFLTDDVASWYSPPSAAETYRQSLLKEYERFKALPKTPGQFQKVLDFFNYAVTHPGDQGQSGRFSKEALRRLLSSSAFIARYLEDEKVKTNKPAVEHIAAYLILSHAPPLTYFTLTRHTDTHVYRSIVPDLSQLQTPDQPFHALAGKQAKIDNYFEKVVKQFSIKDMVADIGLAEEQKGLAEEIEKGKELDEKGKAYKTIIKFQELANQELRSNNRYMSKELMTSFNEARKAVDYLKTIQKNDNKAGEVVALVEPLFELIRKKLA